MTLALYFHMIRVVLGS